MLALTTLYSRKVVKVDVVHSEGLLVVLSGKQPLIKLLSLNALDGEDSELIKIHETRGRLLSSMWCNVV